VPQENSHAENCYLSKDFPDHLRSIDYNFSDISSYEEEACLLYETARHASYLAQTFIDFPELKRIELLTNPKETILRKKQSLSGDSIIAAIKTKTLRLSTFHIYDVDRDRAEFLDDINPQIVLFLGIEGGFPKVKWVDLEPNQKILKLMVYKVSNPEPIELIDYDECEFKGAKSLEDLEKNLIQFRHISHDQKLLSLAIDWRKSDRQLRASFKDLLHCIRPKSQPCTGNDVTKIFGEYKLTMRADKALESLGLWREKCSEDLTWQELVEHRYGTNSSKGFEVLSSETNRNINKLREMLRFFFPLI